MAPNQPQAPTPSAEPRAPQPAATVHVGRQQAMPAVPAPNPAVATATATSTQAPTNLVLPPTVISKADISRSLREVEGLDDYFHQAGLRGSQAQNLPKLSLSLEGVATANGLNLLNADHRSALKAFLTKLKNQAPVIHMSFPSEAGNDFIAKLLEWYRREAHPYAVLHIGLAPDLAAGCTLRTTNKFYDFSFRHRFEESKSKLVAALEAADKAAEAEKPITQAVAEARAEEKAKAETAGAPA